MIFQGFSLLTIFQIEWAGLSYPPQTCRFSLSELVLHSNPLSALRKDI